MAVYSIVGYRRASDGIAGSWTPDIPDGIGFSSICGDTTNTVARLKAGTDAESPTADPNRLAIVRTETPFLSVSRIPLGGDVDGALHADGRFVLESAIGRPLPPAATVRSALRELLTTWDDDDPDQPNALRPTAQGRIKVVLGPDVIEDRPATAAERARRGR